MLTFSSPKINLGLQILNKRPDGFHNLQSVFYPIKNWEDTLEIAENSDFSFTQSGLKIPGKTEDNLVVRAYNLLKKTYNLPNIKIHLHKTIPCGAGLGGGSSNAVSMLELINSFFDLQIDEKKLFNFALELGSDCPFFLKKKPQKVEGRGEILSDINLDLSAYYITLIFPDLQISTAEAFQNLSLLSPKKESFFSIFDQPIETWKEDLINDFEKNIFLKYPILEEIKTKMYQNGAVYASMSGTGSVIYGIFKEKKSINIGFLEKNFSFD